MRRLAATLISLTLVTAACSSDEQMVQPTGPTSVNSPASLTGVPGDSDDSTRIVQLIEGYTDLSQQTIQGLFGTPTSCSGNCNAAMKKFDQIADLFSNKTPPYDLAAAQSNAYDLINWTLSKWKAGELNDPPGDAGVTELVNLLFSYSGIKSTICDLGQDCDITYFDPNSPPTTLQAPSQFAQLQTGYGSATVTQPTVLSVYRLTPDNNLGMLYLATQLDQYELQYEFSTSSGETFLSDVTLTICLANGVTVEDEGRLRLAHNVAQPAPWENIQILPTAGPGNLTRCGLADPTPITFGTGGKSSLLRNFAMRGLRVLKAAVTPQPLYAALVAGTGVTGSSKNLSPFGIVDPVAYITNVSSIDAGAAVVGTSVSDPNLPKVRILTPNGLPMQGDSAIFTITAGGGSLSAGAQTGSSVVVYTDDQGEAALDSWTVGAGTNTVEVTGAVTPCDAPVADSTVADCGTVVDTVTFAADGVPAITAISPSLLPDGVMNAAYSVTFSATGGDNTNYPYQWKLVTSDIPSTLGLSTDGILSGTPDTWGDFSFTLEVKSGPATFTSATYTLKIVPPPVVISPQGQLTPNLIVGLQHTQQLSATGGTGSYSWSTPSGFTSWFPPTALLSPPLPTGNTIGLVGTPNTGGTFNFKVTATSGPVTATASYSINAVYPGSVTLSSPFIQELTGTQCYAAGVPITSQSIVIRVTYNGQGVQYVPVHLVAVTNNGSFVTLTPENVQTDASGLATFRGLTINKAGGYQLRAYTNSPWNSTPVLSNKFKISPKC